jgi:hypothetical protein
MRDQTLSGYDLQQPEWCGDFLDRARLLPGGGKIDSTQFAARPAVRVTLTAAAALGATSLTVTALTAALPPGTALNFGGSGLIAYANEGAAAAATTIAVSPLARAIPLGASYLTPAVPHPFVPSGTVVGRTFAQRDAKSPFHVALDTDDEIFLVAFGRRVDVVNDVDLVRPAKNVVVKENFLPGFAALSATVKGKLRAAYTCTIGAP